MTREEAIQIIKARFYPSHVGLITNHTRENAKALRMAVEALSKPNYETDTEVRLAVTDRNKDKVVLWDAFGEVEYYPCDTSETEFYDEDDYWNGRVPHGRLIDADALSKKLCETTIFIKDGEVFQRMINDAPTVSAEAVQVVRCKDCIHYESDGGALMVCRIDDMVVDDTDYCSYGERKGGDEK